MKPLLTLGSIFLLSSLVGDLVADTYVKGYTRRDGTYVQPHYRSDSNNTKLDNYSTRGNINPYTGKYGTKDPYKNNNGNQNWRNSYNNPYGNDD